MSFEKWSDELAHSKAGSGNQVFRQADLADGAAGETGWKAAVVTPEVWRLRLYVSGDSPKSMAAFANLQRLCETHLADRYQIEIIDLVEHPLLARDEEIVAVPTLVRLSPRPVRKVIGDLTNTDQVLIGLQIRAKKP